MAHKEVDTFPLVLTSFCSNHLMSSLCFLVFKRKKGMPPGPLPLCQWMTSRDKLLPFEWWEEGQDVLEAAGEKQGKPAASGATASHPSLKI